MINTIKEDSVQKNVAKELKITKLKNEDVYNMEVENHHNFAVNGGLIVHNCMDCFRYICQELPYNFIDMRRVAYNNYLKFFDKQVAGPQINSKALSFKEIVGILNEDKIEERTRSNNKTYAGGYYI